jgi:hypothetical protein
MISKWAFTVSQKQQIYVAHVFRNLLLRFIVGTRHENMKKKLSVISPFPYLQVAVNMFRSEESAYSNERTFSGQSGVAAFHPMTTSLTTSHRISAVRVVARLIKTSSIILLQRSMSVAATLWQL